MTETGIGMQSGQRVERTSNVSESIEVDRKLRRVLQVDAAVSGVFGVALLIGAGPLGDLLGLPESMLRWVGVSLIPWAAALIYLATRSVVSRSGVKTVIGLNVAWVIASLLLLVSGQTSPTGPGYAFVVAQAVLVGMFAEVQFNFVRRLSDRQ